MGAGTTTGRLETFVFRSMDEVAGIAGEWDELLERTTSPEVFRTWDWMRTWWEVFGDQDERRPLVIAVRKGQRLVGVSPMQTYSAPGPGPLRSRRLGFWGTGEAEADEVCSDFLDIIAAPGYEDAVCVQVWKCLLAERPPWDEAIFPNVLDDSLLACTLWPLVVGSGRVLHAEASGQRFFVDLGGRDFDGYVESLSKRRRKRVHYYRRRLEKEGFVERRLERKDEIPRFLSEIARLSYLRRSLLGTSSAWQSAHFRHFHELVVPRLWDKGRVDLRLWWRDGVPVAAIYSFLYAGSIYYYQSGFDTAAFGNTSPGLVTLTHIIEWGFKTHYRRFDFLVGQGDSYQADYNCLTEAALTLHLYNTTVTGQLTRAAHALRGLLREARARAAAAGAAPDAASLPGR